MRDRAGLSIASTTSHHAYTALFNYDCSEYFQPKRAQNPSELYVCAGMGRTGTTTFKLLFKDQGVQADHASGVVARLEDIALQSNRTKLGPFNNFAGMLAYNASPRAVMDIPVNTFVWDLVDAFPNSKVSLAVRNVRLLFLIKDVSPF